MRCGAERAGFRWGLLDCETVVLFTPLLESYAWVVLDCTFDVQTRCGRRSERCKCADVRRGWPGLTHCVAAQAAAAAAEDRQAIEVMAAKRFARVSAELDERRAALVALQAGKGAHG